MKLLLPTILFLTSCATAISVKDPLPELRDLKDNYCELSKPFYDQNQMAAHACDAIGFTALHGLGCGYVKIAQFESKDIPGRLCRQPGCMCFDNDNDNVGKKGSASGFSKDMGIMAQAYCATVGCSKQMLERINEYGDENKWLVCEASNPKALVSRCQMSAKIIHRWKQLLKKANGEKPTHLPISLTPNMSTDFRAHLAVVPSILAEYGLYGKISPGSVNTIKYQAKREPKNLLYQAMKVRFVGGSQENLAKKLVKFFPKNRLPKTEDYCTHYLYQRDYYKYKEDKDGEKIPYRNKDWLPCKDKSEQMGTDLILAAWVLTEMK